VGADTGKSGSDSAITPGRLACGGGYQSKETLHAIHQRMHEMVNQAGGKIDVVAFCPHSESEQCSCRKPAPGMLYTICERLNIDPGNMILVGDSLRDMQAAMVTAATPIIVRTGKGQSTLDSNKGLEHIPAYDDLAAYVDTLLAPSEDE